MTLFAKCRILVNSILFNLKYLPFQQAIKLPILVYKMRLISQKGKIIIDSDHIYLGMIQLGFPRAATYPNNGITWRNRGKIYFKGSCKIGNDCYVIVGKKGILSFGVDFKVNAGMKLVSEYSITFGDHTLIGWGVTITDTNFHSIYDLEKKDFKKAYDSIQIGSNNWISTNCMVMYGVHTPDYCIFAARSVLTRNVKYESRCLYGGSPIHVLTRNVVRDYNNDHISYVNIQEE